MPASLRPGITHHPVPLAGLGAPPDSPRHGPSGSWWVLARERGSVRRQQRVGGERDRAFPPTPKFTLNHKLIS